jgi:hypothetical protein
VKRLAGTPEELREKARRCHQHALRWMKRGASLEAAALRLATRRARLEEEYFKRGEKAEPPGEEDAFLLGHLGRKP